MCYSGVKDMPPIAQSIQSRELDLIVGHKV